MGWATCHITHKLKQDKEHTLNLNNIPTENKKPGVGCEASLSLGEEGFWAQEPSLCCQVGIERLHAPYCLSQQSLCKQCCLHGQRWCLHVQTLLCVCVHVYKREKD